jgi:hypothetical protein
MHPSNPNHLESTVPNQTRRPKLHLPNSHIWFDLRQTFAHKQNAINQQSICRTLDLKVAEKRVGTEKRQHLIQGIVTLAIGLGRLRRGDRCIERWKRVSWPASACAEGQEGEVANHPDVGLGVEY